MELKRFKEYFVVGSGIIILGLVLLAVFDLAFLGNMRINEKAGFNAFWTTIGILAVLTYVDLYYPLGLNFRDFFLIVVGVGMFSFHVHRFYYNRKGFK